LRFDLVAASLKRWSCQC